MLDKLPVSMANMDSLGFPSFLTKQMQISFRIKAGANSIITRKYVFVIEKTALSAPKREVISPERKRPAAMNIKAARIPVYTVFVKTVFVSHDIFCPFIMEYLVAPPIPSISPVPCIKL